jgi:catechol 2,3-dioxygenase-like lactoylglutathione lyase family enzyme
MIDHVVLRVKDLGRSRKFYAGALAPLGYTLHKEFPGLVGFGADGKADIWVAQGEAPSSAVHIAIAAPRRKMVDAFHVAALAAGGRDNGAPGIRAHYHKDYYGAFVFDPDGNNIEAVCHDPKG